ncbi:MAG: ABC transporter ATP-binding protein [Acidimicrobiales bacterium]|nr:ABC transporter ATP-binding protein [Acidimicrobiales bacterium]
MTTRPGTLDAGGTVDAASPAIEAVELRREYGQGATAVVAVDGVSFTVAAGAMVCIMGKSGSGKSTLLRQLGLIDVPTSGTLRLEGADVAALDERRRSALRLDRLGYVFQEYALLPELTAAENVALPALMRGARRWSARARADDLLALVDLGDRADHRPNEMSGGQQQRVAIARALVNRPGILFADEPTGNLDSRATETVMEALVRMNQELGVTIVFVSHDPDHRDYASDLVYLRDGRLVEPYF